MNPSWHPQLQASELVTVRSLAEGPHGATLLVTDPRERLLVAKHLHSADLDGLWRTLRTHGETLARLDEAAIVAPEQVLREADSVIWLSTYAGRGSLAAQRLSADPEQLLAWLEALFAALDTLHASGCVHGHLSAENILLQPTDSGAAALRLTDTGVAMRARPAAGATATTGDDIRAACLLAYLLLAGAHDAATQLPDQSLKRLVPRADADVPETLIDAVMAGIAAPQLTSASKLRAALSRWRGGPDAEPPSSRLTPSSLRAPATLDAAERSANGAAWMSASLDVTNDGVLLLSPGGEILDLNKIAAAWLGTETEAARGQPLRDILGSHHLLDHIRRGRSDHGAVVALPHARVTVRTAKRTQGIAIGMTEVRAGPVRSSMTTRYRFADLCGSATSMVHARQRAQQAAAGDMSVLIVGETGTGKEVLAQAIHHASRRGGYPFVGINVAAIPHALLEGEFFGHEPGAFTGALAKGLPGKFELALGGSLLLDEIGDMPLALQVKLLRVLEERSVQRLGGTKPIAIDCRVIATTHRDLDDAIASGNFRLDLYHRLRVIEIRLPPLRERISDLPELMATLAKRYAVREKREPISVHDTVLTALSHYRWPGNVRELANLVEGWTSLLGEDRVVRNVPAHIRRTLDAPTPAPTSPPSSATDEHAPVRPLHDVERDVFAHAIEHFDGNVKQAAAALGVSRATFYNKMARYGLTAKRPPK